MKKAILFFVFILFFSNLYSQWVSTSGPNDASIEPLHVSGTTIFAGTSGNGGIYRSVNNASSWQAANTGIPFPGNVFCFSNLGAKVVAGVKNDIYISSNNGDSWQKITPLNNLGEVRGLGYDGTFLYAAISGVGVARSNDQGTSWTISSTGITDKSIYCLLIANNKIFLGTNTAGIIVSSDKGVNWQEANTGITNKNAFRSLTINGTDIYAASYWAGVYKSTDSGSNWALVNNGLSVTNARRIYSTGTNLFVSTDGGVFKSTNGGTNWVAANNGLNYPFSNNFANIGNTLFVAASNRGVYKSLNNGDLWTASNSGINNSTIKTFVKSGSNLFAGTYNSGGVHYTNNGGATWSATYPSVSNVVQLVSNNSEIYAATAGWGLFKTTNNGVTWSSLSSTFPNLLTVYSVALSGSQIFTGTDTKGVFFSSDNGTTWNEANGNLTAKNINMLTFVGTKLFASTTAGIYATTDKGTTWSLAGLSGKNIITIKQNNNKVYAGTWGDGVYVSSDNGTTWTQIKNGMTYLNIYAIAFDNNNNIYVSCGANVYSSKDGGANWVLKNEGLPHEVYAIEVMDNYLYAGTVTYGVWKRPLTELVTSVKDNNNLPAELSLEQNYPNPFNPITTINYQLPTAEYVTLKVYDVLGREVATLVDEYQVAGIYNSKFITQNYGLTSGIYFYTLKSGNYVQTNKMILTK